MRIMARWRFRWIATIATALLLMAAALPAAAAIDVLYRFGGVGAPRSPGALSFGSDGRLYGVTRWGGPADRGTIFRFDPATGVMQTLASFDGTNGAEPFAAPFQAADGDFYGTAYIGGMDDHGTLWRLSADGASLTTLVRFNGTNGSVPFAGVVQGSDGKLYGTTRGGGIEGRGTLYKVATDGTAFAIVRQFRGHNGSAPNSPLLEASDGFLYGTAGLDNGRGVIFRTNETKPRFTIMHRFDGDALSGSLIEGRDGFLYGTSYIPASIFRLRPDGTSFTELQRFAGAGCYSALTQVEDGSFYCAAPFQGVLHLSADGSTYTVVDPFDGPKGRFPDFPLVEGPDGALYGTAQSGGGPDDGGTLFRLVP